MREVKRLDAISRSPVYSSIGEELAGLATIRAYRAERRLIERNASLVDRSVVFSLVNQSMNRRARCPISAKLAPRKTAAPRPRIRSRLWPRSGNGCPKPCNNCDQPWSMQWAGTPTRYFTPTVRAEVHRLKQRARQSINEIGYFAGG